MIEDDDGRQRRALGRLLSGLGELLEDDEKRAAVEAKVREVRARIDADPSLAIDLARQLANALKRGRGQ